MLGNYPGVTIQDAIRAPFESSAIPVSELVTYTPTKVEARVLDDGSQLAGYRADDDRENTITAIKLSMVNQSSAAGDQKGTTRMNITHMAADMKLFAIFNPILATRDNSVTAAKVRKKPSVAARMGIWLRRFFSCTKKPELKE